jgi:pyrroline-5-carboxylate reductase
MAAKLTIGFLGAGKMATALAKGVISAGLVKPNQVRASDPIAAACAAFTRETGAKASDSNLEVVDFASVLILAVKPGNVAPLLQEIRPRFAPQQLLISIAAGMTIAKLEAGLGDGARVIRVMPNTPALVGASATAYAIGSDATEADAKFAERFFSAAPKWCSKPASIREF